MAESSFDFGDPGQMITVWKPKHTKIKTDLQKQTNKQTNTLKAPKKENLKSTFCNLNQILTEIIMTNPILNPTLEQMKIVGTKLTCASGIESFTRAICCILT